MNSHFKMPRHMGEALPSNASQPSSFQKVLMMTPPERGEGYARSHLEENGVFRSKPGQKRKLEDDGEAGSDHQRKANSVSTDGWDHSNWSNPLQSTPTPEKFKRPQPLQRARQLASQSTQFGDEREAEGTPSKKSRVEALSTSPPTNINLAMPLSSNSGAFTSGRSSSPLSSNGSGTSHQMPSLRRAEHTPTPGSKTPKFKPRKSSSSATDVRDSSVCSPNGNSQVSEPQRPTFKPLNKPLTTESARRDRTLNSTREQVNSNGSRLTNANSVHVPTIDRQIQHPPPEPAELNRILAQVPDILKELDEKQAEVIRSLATKVNRQEEEIKELKSANVELNDSVTSSHNLIMELRNKFAQMEKKMDDEIGVLKKENEELREHINNTGESIVTQVKRKLEKFEEKSKMEDYYEPSEQLIDVQDPEKAEEEETSIFLQH